MTTEEAKAKISTEMIEGFHEWLNDENELDDMTYGKKYGWCKSQVKHTDDLKSFMTFREYFFTGRYIQYWEKAGYTKQSIYALHEEKWLSYKFYSNWNARATGRQDWYFIPVRTAKEIYKAWKNKESMRCA